MMRRRHVTQRRARAAWAMLIALAVVWSSFLCTGGYGAAEAAGELQHNNMIAMSPWHSIKMAISGARHHLVAAAVARCVSISAFYPLDTIKTRMQMVGGGLGIQEGISGLYAGLGGSLFGQVPYGMLTFGTYEMYKTAMLNCDGLSGVPQTLVFCVAAILGDLTGSLWLVPSEVVKLQMQGGMHASVSSATLSILKESGVGGFYQGYSGQVVRDVPFRALQMTSYEILKSLHQKWTTTRATATCTAATTTATRNTTTRGRNLLQFRRATRSSRNVEAAAASAAAGTVPKNSDGAGAPALSGVDTAVLGAMAGTIAAALTTPLDVLRTRKMTTGAGSGLGSLGRDLFAGLGPRVALIGPSCAVFFVVYEGLRKRLAVAVPPPPAQKSR